VFVRVDSQLNSFFSDPSHQLQPPYKLGLGGIVSKRRNSPYLSGRSADWIKSKNPAAPAVRRETEEDWSR
jgi:ATP-dependent DNA ligase